MCFSLSNTLLYLAIRCFSIECLVFAFARAVIALCFKFACVWTLAAPEFSRFEPSYRACRLAAKYTCEWTGPKTKNRIYTSTQDERISYSMDHLYRRYGSGRGGCARASTTRLMAPNCATPTMSAVAHTNTLSHATRALVDSTVCRCSRSRTCDIEWVNLGRCD